MWKPTGLGGGSDCLPTRWLSTLDAVTIFAPGERTFAAARNIGPDTLRTFDAVHLAAALELGADLDAVVTYDRRLAAGCVAAGCNIRAPGLSDGWLETTP